MTESLRDVLGNVFIAWFVVLILFRRFTGNDHLVRRTGPGLVAAIPVGWVGLYLFADTAWASIAAIVTVIVVTALMALRSAQQKTKEQTTTAGPIGSQVQPLPEPVMRSDDAVEAYMRQRDQQNK